MKTTVEIPDRLLAETRRLAEARGMTLREILEVALRRLLAAEDKPRRPFRLKDGSFRGDGLREGLAWGDWDTLRALIYEEHGG